MTMAVAVTESDENQAVFVCKLVAMCFVAALRSSAIELLGAFGQKPVQKPVQRSKVRRPSSSSKRQLASMHQRRFRNLLPLGILRSPRSFLCILLFACQPTPPNLCRCRLRC